MTRKRINIARSFMALLALVTLIGVIGCKTADDNPVSAQDMKNIREQESRERENFNPGERSGSPTDGR